MYLYHSQLVGDILPLGTLFKDGQLYAILRGEDAGSEEDTVLEPLTNFRVPVESPEYLVQHPDFGMMLVLRETKTSVTAVSMPSHGNLDPYAREEAEPTPRSRWEYWYRTGKSIWGGPVTVPAGRA